MPPLQISWLQCCSAGTHAPSLVEVVYRLTSVDNFLDNCTNELVRHGRHVRTGIPGRFVLTD
eukprot:SAG31_NODE_2911_length_4921_cov_2.526752_6_plen_62_part_00